MRRSNIYVIGLSRADDKGGDGTYIEETSAKPKLSDNSPKDNGLLS